MASGKCIFRYMAWAKVFSGGRKRMSGIFYQDITASSPYILSIHSWISLSQNSLHSKLLHCYGYFTLKPGIHLRQRKTEAWCGSLSSASVDGATNRATCLRGCRDPSCRLSVDQSKANPRNSPLHMQYGQNMLCLAETEKHSLLWCTSHQGAKDATPHLSLPLPLAYSQLYMSSMRSTFEILYTNSSFPRTPNGIQCLHQCCPTLGNKNQ